MALTMERISAPELYDRLKSKHRPVLINALSKEAFQAKRIPGSINLTEDNLECAEQILPDKDQDIVVYCANADCDASPNLANKLTDMGYKNVWDFEKGLAGWREAGYNLKGSEVN
ncbi:rhodanese-like domain-containing protein [Fodinibius halophilus]|uniref:Rhodanese-like domain-containing protein n=1 Tax=Fodinibius halophilus TaxID=1736908 RepID=A0A6M1T9Y1_9BACT|nr:rhodanese-like domain-containing protein [Fodinibius halophilus]NGP88841.1 rhodanese-like domain-containing protein [Fodinibius halophilus]